MNRIGATGGPETGEQLHCNALATDLPAGRHDIAGPAERARTRRTVENSVFREPGKSCRPERDFGHGPKTPSGVPAILDLIALLMQGASRMIRDRGRQLAGGGWRLPDAGPDEDPGRSCRVPRPGPVSRDHHHRRASRTASVRHRRHHVPAMRQPPGHGPGLLKVRT